MPWEEVSIMEQRVEFVMLAREEGSNVRELCRRFGISPPTGYKWLARREAGDEALSDRSRRPHSSPGRTADTTEQVVLSVRDAHPAWGARKIVQCLKRDGLTPPAASTVHAILVRHGRIVDRPGGDRAVQRFEKPAANLLWQMDFKGRVPLIGDGWAHPLTVVDDHSRYAVCLQACANQRTATVQGCLRETFRRYGLPDAFFVDNGSPWGGGVPGQWTPLGVWLLKLGIDVIHSRPYHPQSRGKSERFHRTLKAELLNLRRFAELERMQRAFDRWRLIYNTERPHQALDQQVPASRYRVSERPMPETMPAVEYEADDIVRKVSPRATISYRNRLWKMPKAFRGEHVALRPRGQDGQYGVFFGARQIATVDLNKPGDHKQ